MSGASGEAAQPPPNDAKKPKKKPMGPTLPTDVAKNLDDEDFFKLYKEGALQTREHISLSEDNWEEELERIPLFMTKQPTPEDIENSPDLQAMQALIQAESTPTSRAENAKEHGNSIFLEAKKSKETKKVITAEYNKAIVAYDSALKEKSKNKALNSTIYSNRAAVNLLLGNKRRAINDCKTAIELNPDNVKAYWRACTANTYLGHYAEAIGFADSGLRVDPTNKVLAADRQKAVKLKATVDKRARQIAQTIRKKEQKEASLLAAFTKRKLRFQKPIEVEMDVSLKGIAAAGGEVVLDAQGLLHWPATFLYPEHQQTDFITDFCEGHDLGGQLGLMFGPKESIPWDVDSKYRAGQLSVYFETQPEAAYKKTKMVRVDPRLTLLEAVQDPRYTVVDLTPAFFVLASGSPFEKKFLAQAEYDGAAVDTSALNS